MLKYIPRRGGIERKRDGGGAPRETPGRPAPRGGRLPFRQDNPKYTPFIDTGDHVIVINAKDVKLTGMKSESKKYYHYTGFPGGIREEEFKKKLERRPEQVLELAIKGMLPKNKLGRAMGSKLK